MATMISNTSVTDTGITSSCDPTKKQWWIFFLSSVLTLVAGVFLVLFGKLIVLIHKEISRGNRHHTAKKVADTTRSKEKQVDKQGDIGWVTSAKDWAGELISGQTTSGKILVVFVFFLSVASLVVFFIDADSTKIEECIVWQKATTAQVDLALNVFFMMYFFLRFVAAQDKIPFLFEMYSIVDYFTVSPSFASIYFERRWLGLRFLRALRLLNLPDILQYLNVLRTNSHIKIARLLSRVLAFWLTSAGLVHLCENSGDPWRYPPNIQELSFWNCGYFILVTSTTVGYGDIYCETTLGKLFMVFIIMAGLAIFASAIPEIYELVQAGGKYSGSYKCEKGKRHIVVCGHITYESVSSFLADFLHKDREDIDVEIIFLDKRMPHLDLEGLFKRHFTRVEFFLGSVMDANDLERVVMKNADACLILANKYCDDPDAEDAANVMRAVSIKNSYANIKIIIQLMQYHNKAYLLNVPCWDWKRGDDAVCLAELKLGFIAQSCVAPGFSTLLANLFTMRSYKVVMRTFHQLRGTSLLEDGQVWQNDYLRGTGMEMYTQIFSAAFIGMSFPMAAELCFTKLHLLLIAIEVKTVDGGTNIAINPGPKARVEAGTQGFFIAQSDDEAKRAHFYCQNCHCDLTDVKLIKKCRCKGRMTAMVLSQVVANNQHSIMSNFSTNPSFESSSANISDVEMRDGSDKKMRIGTGVSRTEFQQSNNNYLGHAIRTYMPPSPELDLRRKNKTDKKSEDKPATPEQRFDPTGMFHWCPEQDVTDCLVTNMQTPPSSLSHHIVVCIFSKEDSPLIGLGSFIMPLRASNYHYSELKHVILLGNMEYLSREWTSIKNFPKIHVMPGSPLNRSNLRAVNISTCDMCVILSARKGVNETDDPSLVDKSAILCSLNIKSMTFDDTLGLMIKNKRLPGFMPPGFSPISSPTKLNSKVNQRGEAVHGANIPMITELANDSNVQFLDQDDDDDPDTELYMTQPFACGTAFAVSVLDSLMSTSYFNENALTLIRTLITGGATPELEQILAEGAGIPGCQQPSSELEHVRDRCKVGQISVYDGPFAQFGDGGRYMDLFVYALKYFGILCIGLHRFRDTKDNTTAASCKRYVITNPSADFTLLPTDMAFCFLPYDVELRISQQQTVERKKKRKPASSRSRSSRH
ncbi:calcium-activated potassium channel slowpoke-like isoform X2 [Watersipora subatra]|uniref:calcium-activated potassium channel slowpoke-like isoform X2 n=1 Tax=Watersipora subatra TaxID=2589382 RepID=UPI00355BF196